MATRKQRRASNKKAKIKQRRKVRKAHERVKDLKDRKVQALAFIQEMMEAQKIMQEAREEINRILPSSEETEGE